MLLKDFYKINEIAGSGDSYTVKVELNTKHEIYKGHFPEQPVVPGVCTMQLVKECIEQIVSKSLYYSQIQSCKFLSVVDPTANNLIELVLNLKEGEDGNINLQADILQKEQSTTKLKAVLTVA